MATTVLSIRQNGRRNKPEADAVKGEVLESSQGLVIVDEEVPEEAAFELQAKEAEIADGFGSRHFTNGQLNNYRSEQVRSPLVNWMSSYAFACPFQKYRETVTTQTSPQREHHHRCLVGVFSSVSLLKDHILKAHFRSICCCRTCYKGFETTAILEAHGRCNRPCPPRPCGLRETISNEPSNQIAISDESEALKEYWYTTYRTLFPDSPEPSSPYVPFYENVSCESICQPRCRDVDADHYQTPSLSSGTSDSRSLAPSDLSCQNLTSIGSNESRCAKSDYQSRRHWPANATPATSTFCLRTDPASLLSHVGAQFSGVDFGNITQQENGLKVEDRQSSISADELHPNLAGAILPVRTATGQFVAHTAGDPGGAPNDGYQAEASGNGRKRVRDEHLPSSQLFPDDKLDESESESEQPPSGAQLSDSAGPQANRTVKCPFAALNPEAHSKCKRPFRNTDALTRIKGGTGHLLRKHENDLSEKAKDYLLKRNGKKIPKQYGDENLSPDARRWIEIFRICGDLKEGSLEKSPSPWFGDTNFVDLGHVSGPNATKKARTKASAASTSNTAETVAHIKESPVSRAYMEALRKERNDDHARRVAERRAQAQEEFARRCAQIELEINVKAEEDIQKMDAEHFQKDQKLLEFAASHGIEMNSSSTSQQTDAVSAQLPPEVETIMQCSQSNGPVAISPPPANYHGRVEWGRSTEAPDRSTMIPDSSSYFTELSSAFTEEEHDRSASSCTSFEWLLNYTPDGGSRSNTSASSSDSLNINPRLLTTQVDAGACYTDDDLQVSHGDGTLTRSR